jgi:uncharacterized protein (TIGR02270 family)
MDMMPMDAIQRPIGFRPWEIAALVNEEIVEQHADEASFLWLLRDNAVRATNYNLHDLADLDDRLEANLDGLRLAEDAGWAYCEAGLAYEEPGEVFAAGVVAFEGSDERHLKYVLETACSAPELGRALGSAMGWLAFKTIKSHAGELLKSENTIVARIGLTAFALHRQDPGALLIRAMESTDPLLRARAFKAVGEFGQEDLAGALLNASSETDEACRFCAAWSAARLGIRNNGVCNVLKMFAREASCFSEPSADMLMRCEDIQAAKTFFKELVQSPQTLRSAVIAAGALGDPQLVDDLLVLMESEAIARKAGEAFSMITGVDFEYEDFDAEAPEGFSCGPSEAPEDEAVDLDPDEHLPWPNVELIKRWWQANRRDYRGGTRYIRGMEMASRALTDALLQGTQPQRTAAALEIAVRNPMQPLFATRAPGKRQLALLSKWNSSTKQMLKPTGSSASNRMAVSC